MNSTSSPSASPSASPLSNEELHRLAKSEHLRSSTVIHLGTAIFNESNISDQLSEFLDDAYPAGLRQLFPGMPDSVVEETLGLETSSPETFVEWLLNLLDQEEDHPSKGRLGFLVRFHTPFGSRVLSWDLCSSRWVYGDTMEDALREGIAWAQKRRTSVSRKRNPAHSSSSEDSQT